MSSRRRLVVALLAGLVLLGLGTFVQRQLSSSWVLFGSHPEVIASLEHRLEDQRALATAYPESAAEHRAAYEETQRLLNRLRVLELSRSRMLRNYRWFLLLALGGAVLTVALYAFAFKRRTDRRLDEIQDYLRRLSAGDAAISVGRQRSDAIGRIARMIEQASATIADQRRRIGNLEHLSSWQEGARRLAHEIRTPLAAVQLNLARLEAGLGGSPEQGESLPLVERLREDFARIHSFIDRFTSMARLPRPELERHDLAAFLIEFAEGFSPVWPNLTLRVEAPSGIFGRFDAGLLREALANLCHNASEATEEVPCRVEIRLTPRPNGVWIDVADDGPGVPPSLVSRLFSPYVTSRRDGSRMGLGLPIARKILLDHGGDLELVGSSTHGSRFRLHLPSNLEEGAAAPENALEGARRLAPSVPS
jgi:signal transduction histidine kinase